MKLPEPVTVATVFATGEKVQIPGYTAEQMLAWGKANAEAEREACAKVASEIGNATNPDDWALDRCQDIEAAIRARGENT
jgi:hypothetical protein